MARYNGILNEDVPKGLFLEHFFMRSPVQMRYAADAAHGARGE